MSTPGEWERLCALLDEDEAVQQAVVNALQQGEDPWEALLDGLDDAGALAYLQANDTGMELTDALAQLPRVFAVQPDLDEVTDTDDLTEATRLADRTLAGSGLRLVRLIEDDDSWPIVAVRDDEVDEVVAAAERLGRRVELAR